MAETAGNITADRELTDGDSLDAYGLDDPVYTLEYTDADGNVTELLFGNMAGDDYYVMKSRSDTVYTVASSVIDPFNYALDDMAQLDDYPSIGSGNLVKEVITQDGGTTTYDSENDDQAEDIAAVAGGLGAVTLSEAADYSVEDEIWICTAWTGRPELRWRPPIRRMTKISFLPCISEMRTGTGTGM